VRKYLQERYQKDFESRMKERAGQEQKELCQEFVEELQHTVSLDNFCSLLKSGMTRGMVHMDIHNMASLGFSVFHDAILNKAQDVTLRAEKLLVWYSGRDLKGEPVWNGGNILRTPRNPVKYLLLEIGAAETWKMLEDRMVNRAIHTYRDSQVPNRHGHLDVLPSYWALGFETLKIYFQSVDNEEQEQYVKKHQSCCGVSSYVSNLQAAQL